MLVDGIQQAYITESGSCDDSELWFAITNVSDRKLTNIEIILEDGYPFGHADEIVGKTVLIGREIFDVQPRSGSSAGTLLTLTGSGYGSDTDLDGFTIEARIDGNWVTLCDEVTIPENGKIQCFTLALEAADSDIRIYSEQSWNIASEAGEAIKYNQLAATSTPIVEEIAVSGSPGNTITFTGTGFNTSTLLSPVTAPEGRFRGAVATEVSRTDTQVVVMFANGVPTVIVEDNEVPKLHFVATDFEIRAQEALTNAYTAEPLLTINQADSVSCSFAGGCSFSVTAPGLTAALQSSDENQITVCGNVCVLDSSSDEGIATCTLAPLVTPYSANEFKLTTSALLDGSWSGSGDDEELAKLNDGKPTVNYVDPNNSCELEFTASSVDYLYNIEEVGIYITSLADVSPYIGNLIFQGLSYDGNSWSDLWVVDSSVHKGWNRVQFDSEGEGFKNFRFQGNAAGSCKVGEIELKGFEVLDAYATDDFTVCTPKLTLAGVVLEEIVSVAA